MCEVEVDTEIDGRRQIDSLRGTLQALVARESKRWQSRIQAFRQLMHIMRGRETKWTNKLCTATLYPKWSPQFFTYKWCGWREGGVFEIAMTRGRGRTSKQLRKEPGQIFAMQPDCGIIQHNKLRAEKVEKARPLGIGHLGVEEQAPSRVGGEGEAPQNRAPRSGATCNRSYVFLGMLSSFLLGFSNGTKTSWGRVLY